MHTARDADEIRSPTSSIITKDVVEAYSQIAGDFAPAVPFALLEARRFFARQAASNPADSDENTCRKVACEAIARRIVQRTPMEEQYALLSKRYTLIESDGDESLPTSALESAVDQRATYFLSSNEAQRCVFAVWKGLLVQQQQPDGNIEYQRETTSLSLFLRSVLTSFHLQSSRSVPSSSRFGGTLTRSVSPCRVTSSFSESASGFFSSSATRSRFKPRTAGSVPKTSSSTLNCWAISSRTWSRCAFLPVVRCKAGGGGLTSVILRADLQDWHLRDHLGVADRQLAHLLTRRCRFRVRSFCLQLAPAPLRARRSPASCCLL